VIWIERSSKGHGMGRFVSDGEASKKPDQSGSDVVLIHGVTDDGKGLRVLRARDERLELGQVRPLEEGKPLQGDVVKLTPRPEAPFVCDVETQVKLPEPAPSPAQRASSSAKAEGAPSPRRKGPPQVATRAYRENWDAIWQTASKKIDLLN
jgi:hypothetical protein